MSGCEFAGINTTPFYMQPAELPSALQMCLPAAVILQHTAIQRDSACFHSTPGEFLTLSDNPRRQKTLGNGDRRRWMQSSQSAGRRDRRARGWGPRRDGLTLVGIGVTFLCAQSRTGERHKRGFVRGRREEEEEEAKERMQNKK